MRLKLALLLALFAACTTVNPDSAISPASSSAELVPDAIVVLADGRVLFRVSGGGKCEAKVDGGNGVPLPFCEGALRRSGTGASVSGSATSFRLAASGDSVTITRFPYQIVDSSIDHEVVILDDRLIWRRGNRVIPLGTTMEWSDARILAQSDAVILVRRDSGTLVRFNADGVQLLIAVDEVKAVESFDVSPDEKELVFSGRRTDSFDVGLVSTQGSKVSWIVPDQLDEVGVSWAPRGSKVTYQVRAPYGTILRSVHVPTSWQLAVDLPFSRVQALSWEPRAEKFAVLHSGPTHSPAIEWISFGGEVRSMVAPSRWSAEGESEPFSDGVLIRPATLRYNQKVPLIIVVVDDALTWRPALAEARKGEVAVAVVSEKGLTQALSDARVTGWIDSAQLYVIGRPLEAAPLTVAAPELRFTAGEGTPRFRLLGKPGSVVEGKERDALESFAVASILDKIASIQGND